MRWQAISGLQVSSLELTEPLRLSGGFANWRMKRRFRVSRYPQSHLLIGKRGTSKGDEGGLDRIAAEIVESHQI